MKDSELQIDRSCHVLYSKPCKKEILAKITLHYPEVEREAVCFFPSGAPTSAVKRIFTTARAAPTTASPSCAFTMCAEM